MRHPTWEGRQCQTSNDPSPAPTARCARHLLSREEIWCFHDELFHFLSVAKASCHHLSPLTWPLCGRGSETRETDFNASIIQSRDWLRWLFIIHHEELIKFIYMNTAERACKHPNNMQQKKNGWTYNSFKVSLPCFHHMENIKPDGEEITSHWHRCSDGSLFIMFWLLNPDKRIDCERLLHLGGTAKTSGWRWAKPNGSLSSFSRVSTQVWMGLRWVGMAAAHFLSKGRGQSTGGGGRSAEGNQQGGHSSICITDFYWCSNKICMRSFNSLNLAGSTRFVGSSRLVGSALSPASVEAN